MFASLELPNVRPVCPACGSRFRQTRAGKTLYGDQRYQCQDCKRYYSMHNRRYRYPEDVRRKAVDLREAGCSLRQIAQQLAVNHQTVSNWVKVGGAER